MSTKSTGHSKSQVYQNHLKTGTDQPSGVEYIADQVEKAGHRVERMNMVNEVYKSDLSTWSKAEVADWAQWGWELGSKKVTPTFRGMTDFQYDQAAKRGIAIEYHGRVLAPRDDGRKAAQHAREQKKKRIK